jgi:hypothetical protein
MNAIKSDDIQKPLESKTEIGNPLVTAAGLTNSTEPFSTNAQKEFLKSSGEAVIRTVSESEIRSMLLEAADGRPEDGDAFFQRFTYTDGVFQTLTEGVNLLKKLKQLDNGAYVKIHKGTPFYWLGVAAFLVNDFQTATFFFDSAVSEDIRAGKDPVNNSAPALRFIQIEGEQPGQAAKRLVEAMQQKIEDAIADYNKRSGRPGLSDLQLVQIRENFLRLAVSPGYENWRSLATAFISYFLEWSHRSTLMEVRPGSGTAEPFFLHLLKGCLLFESLLKANPQKRPHGTTLDPILKNLASDLGMSANLKIHGASFTGIVQDLSSADNEIQTAIKFAGRIRNAVGHDLGWEAAFDRSHFDRLASMIASSCLHAIACLYR